MPVAFFWQAWWAFIYSAPCLGIKKMKCSFTLVGMVCQVEVSINSIIPPFTKENQGGWVKLVLKCCCVNKLSSPRPMWMASSLLVRMANRFWVRKQIGISNSENFRVVGSTSWLKSVWVSIHKPAILHPKQKKWWPFLLSPLLFLRMTFVKDIKNTWAKIAAKMGVEVNPAGAVSWT